MDAVVYARYSSDNQREESITAQLRAINGYAKKEGIHILHKYIDEAESAKTDNRPQFLKMMEDITTGAIKADLVLVHKLDRFARNRYDSAIYRKKLKDNNMRLLATSQPLDDSPESIILESMLEAMAEYYSLNLGREALKGMRENAYKGMHTGGTPPLGYDVDPKTKKYILNKKEAIIVKMIYDMAVSGQSYNTIIDTCNDKGYKTKRGKTFGKNSINSILKNEKYTGLYIFNKLADEHNGHKYKPREEWITVENAMPVIIEKEEWEKVQEILSGRTRQRNRGDRPYLLTGKVVCGECGGPMVGSRSKGRNDNYYYFYVCSNRKRLRICKNTGIRADYLENYVLNEIEEKCFPRTQEDIDHESEELMIAYENKLKSEDGEIEHLKNDVIKTDNKINRFLEAFENGSMTGEIAGKRLEELKKERDLLQNRIKHITAARPEITIDTFKNYFMQNKNSLTNRNDVSELQRIIKICLDSITVFPGSKDQSKVSIKLKHDVFGYYGSGEGIIVISETTTKAKLYGKMRK